MDTGREQLEHERREWELNHDRRGWELTPEMEPMRKRYYATELKLVLKKNQRDYPGNPFIEAIAVLAELMDYPISELGKKE